MDNRQSHDKVSDAEAKARADFDIRWKVALRIEVEDRPFAKSTLQVFRAQLILHGKVLEVFESSLRLARESGFPAAFPPQNVFYERNSSSTCVPLEEVLQSRTKWEHSKISQEV